MKSIACTAFLFTLLLAGCNQRNADPAIAEHQRDSQPAQTESTTQFANQLVEVSCGQCQLGMDGNGCDLAVRINGKSYYVDGSTIDDHGDAHGDDGLCNCIRKAKVTGEIKEGRFVATSIKAMPNAKTTD